MVWSLLTAHSGMSLVAMMVEVVVDGQMGYAEPMDRRRSVRVCGFKSPSMLRATLSQHHYPLWAPGCLLATHAACTLLGRGRSRKKTLKRLLLSLRHGRGPSLAQ